MLKFQSIRISRRGAIAGAIAGLGLLVTHPSIARQSERPAAIDLGHGLEIRDYRLFPTGDVMRFIVEIHNTTDNAIDTPNVLVMLPHMREENVGWANPISTVLHPKTSDCLIGVAPAALESDEDWGEPKWALCAQVQTKAAADIEDWDFRYSYITELVSDTHARTKVKVTNHNEKLVRGLILQGLVRDRDGRMCGSLLPISLSRVEPGETDELIINLQPGQNFIANPFTLIDSVGGLETSFTMQPTEAEMNPGCPAIFTVEI